MAVMIWDMGIFGLFRRQQPYNDPRLHGRWLLTRSDDPTMDIGEGVEMEFTSDGKLTYTIKQNDRLQIMNLVYKVRDSMIVSNQPSAPTENRTLYTFDDQGLLVLDFDGSRSWYRRLPPNIDTESLLEKLKCLVAERCSQLTPAVRVDGPHIRRDSKTDMAEVSCWFWLNTEPAKVIEILFRNNGKDLYPPETVIADFNVQLNEAIESLVGNQKEYKIPSTEQELLLRAAIMIYGGLNFCDSCNLEACPEAPIYTDEAYLALAKTLKKRGWISPDGMKVFCPNCANKKSKM